VETAEWSRTKVSTRGFGADPKQGGKGDRERDYSQAGIPPKEYQEEEEVVKIVAKRVPEELKVFFHSTRWARERHTLGKN